MHAKPWHLTIMLALILASAGCAGDTRAPGTSSVTIGDSPYVRGDLGSLTYRAVDLLLAAAPEVGADTPLVVTSIADTQNLERTSALGNIIADMIRTRLVQDGRTTTEIRLRTAMSFDHGEGEFLLSRNRHALMRPSNTAAVVTGTYASTYDLVYVSLKMIGATNARIIAGADFVLPVHDVGGLVCSPGHGC